MFIPYRFPKGKVSRLHGVSLEAHVRRWLGRRRTSLRQGARPSPKQIARFLGFGVRLCLGMGRAEKAAPKVDCGNGVQGEVVSNAFQDFTLG